MIILNGKNSYYIPAYSRNRVSDYPVKNIYNSDFKFELKVKIDWKNLIKGQRAYGIASFNGMDMGVFCGVYGEQRMIMAQIWTDGEEKADMEEVFIDVNDDNDIFDIKFEYQYESKIVLSVNGITKELILKNKPVDYSQSMLWLGCCNNHPTTPENLKGNLTGEIYNFSLYSNDDCIAKYDFKKQTDFKTFDISGNGNHLVKTFIQDNIILDY